MNQAIILIWGSTGLRAVLPSGVVVASQQIAAPPPIP